MRIAWEWLKEYIDINISPEDFEEQMILTGTNSEGIVKIGENLDNVVSVEVVEIKKHEESDRLNICFAKESENSPLIQVVTAATNMQVGSILALAKHPSTLADGSRIKKSKLRGILSNGMFCSYQELGFIESIIPKKALSGLLVLNPNAKKDEFLLGKSIKEELLLDDPVFEFEITPNRPDCLSVMGIAREAASVLNINYTEPVVKYTETSDFNTEKKLIVEATDLCSKYNARIITNVKITDSPIWFQIRLMKSGIRPINNMVDITNYVLLECSQPLHAFDFDKIEGDIIIRRAKKGEKLLALDDIEYTLDENDLVIADDVKILAIAGVIGGKSSAISEETTNVLIEIANFKKESILETSKKLKIRTESSSRFEKGLPSAISSFASKRVCNLIQKLEIGEITRKTFAFNQQENEELSKKIICDVSKVNSLLGLKLTVEEIKNILQRIGCKVEQAEGFEQDFFEKLFVTPSCYRLDLLEEVDLIEEIARIYGYNSIPSDKNMVMNSMGKTNLQKTYSDIKQFLQIKGFNECKTYAFTGEKTLQKAGFSSKEGLKILNPLGEEFSIMRNTLLANMLQVVSYNQKRHTNSLLLFEIGKVFLNNSPLHLCKEFFEQTLSSENRDSLVYIHNFLQNKPIQERETLCICASDKDYDFLRFKGLLESMLYFLGIERPFFAPFNHSAFHIGQCASMSLQDTQVCVIGQIDQNISQNFDIKNKIYALELDLQALLSFKPYRRAYSPVSKYPTSFRDIAIIVDEKITHNQLISCIQSSGMPFLIKAELFDVYRGEQIEQGKKSMAYALEFGSKERTLTDEELDKVAKKIELSLQEMFEAKLR